MSGPPQTPGLRFGSRGGGSGGGGGESGVFGIAIGVEEVVGENLELKLLDLLEDRYRSVGFEP